MAYDYAVNVNQEGACGKILAEHCARTGTGSIVQGRVVVPSAADDDDDGRYYYIARSSYLHITNYMIYNMAMHKNYITIHR